MSVTWTNELTEMLIDLYQKQRVLWDSTDSNYKNKNKKKDALKEISDAMGIHDLEITRKIKNLSAQFFREKKKIKNCNKSGAAPSDTPKWFAFQRLLFLSDRNEPRICVEKGINEVDVLEHGLEKSTEEEISQKENLLPNEIIETNDATVHTSLDSPPKLTQPDTRTKLKGSKRKKSIYDQRQEEAYNVLKELQAKKSPNRFSMFGELVATKIEALPSTYAQNIVEYLISHILFEASIGNYEYPALRQKTPFSTHSSSSTISIPIHLPLPNDPSPPSTQLEHPTIASEQSQNTVPQIEQTLTQHYRSSPLLQSEYPALASQNIQKTVPETRQYSSNILYEATNNANIIFK